MPLFLFDTLTRRKREFKPLHDKEVRLYSCGLTVYNFGHIGNFSHYIFVDFLKRYLKFEGYKVMHVRNITDVGHLVDDADEGEDKMLRASRLEKKDPWEIAKFYTEAFSHDCETLGLEKPDQEPKATDHIQGMIDMIATLIEKGIAYKAKDGVYFDISKFPQYGELSGNKVADLEAGARVEVNTNKKNPVDFALWKTDQPEHIMQWDSPWGRGYPGWHIECSAMSKEYLGEQLDIHTGGEDNIFPHHECEIAQSEGVSGKKFVNFWMHKRYLLVEGEKMSKSKGNFYTLSDLHLKWLEQGFSGDMKEAAQIFKFLVLSAHYRSQLDFGFKALTDAYKAWEKIDVAIHRAGDAVPNDTIKGIREEFEKYELHFYQALGDDLNTPNALAAMFDYVRELNAALDGDGISLVEQEHAETFFNEFQGLFGVDINLYTLTPDLMDMVMQREEARKVKDFALSDKLRAELLAKGVEVKDKKTGVEWRRTLILSSKF